MSNGSVKRSGVNSALRAFLRSEASGGILLMVAAAVALILANSPWHDWYHEFFHHTLAWTPIAKLNTWHLWINDGLMAIFFFYVGLEIKREFVDGRLATWERRRLPILSAAAGMVIPAMIFLGIIYLMVPTDPERFENGWAIPAATDIAFAIGVLALLGKRAPASLKLFLVTVAIVDDMGAVAIIALAYTETLYTFPLLLSAITMGIMYACNKGGIRSIWIYTILAVILWFFVLKSGVHATVAGVLGAMMVPIIQTPGAPDSKTSPLHIMEHGIHPWSSYLIIPVFGFANAGVYMGEMGLAEIFAPVPIAIASGLFFGKQIGIFGSVWLAVKLGFAEKLGGASWKQIYGVSMLCGIGFTMSLFIGELAFPGTSQLAVELREEAKVGILMGSIASALAGYLLLRFAPEAKETLVEQVKKEEAA